MNKMLTRREVLMQLRRVGVRKFSQLKRDCREFEHYMAANYDYEFNEKYILRREFKEAFRLG
jgi:hypothetical protein